MLINYYGANILLNKAVEGLTVIMIEEIIFDDIVYAIVIKGDYDKKGISFVTPDNYSQQVAYMNHESGHRIQPHYHNQIERTVFYTQEVLIIKQGKLRADFYNKERKKLGERVLNEGDLILLCYGGHGFEVIEEVKMIEIKQGPYVGEQDKTRFEPLI